MWQRISEMKNIPIGIQMQEDINEIVYVVH